MFLISTKLKPHFLLTLLLTALLFSGCEDVDVLRAASAGIDAFKAVTLTDRDVQNLSSQSSEYSDNQNTIAAPDNPYAIRLKRLTGSHQQIGSNTFNYKVYLSDTVNAFAMGDGTIRLYSGLMDMMNDQELLFVIGHEMGHVAKQHIRKKMRLAYASSAVRKGIASLRNEVGALASSQIGAFAQKLINAQFSQKEEKEADDYGLNFLLTNGYKAEAAIAALRKLATLGNDHSFLSSHPAPGLRAERLENRLALKDA